MPRLGAHLSAAGGVSRAATAAAEIGCQALQVFLRAPGRWAAAALPDAEASRFRSAVRAGGLDGACFAHAPYLLNLASASRALRTRSIAVLVEELQRAGYATDPAYAAKLKRILGSEDLAQVRAELKGASSRPI